MSGAGILNDAEIVDDSGDVLALSESRIAGPRAVLIEAQERYADDRESVKAGVAVRLDEKGVRTLVAWCQEWLASSSESGSLVIVKADDVGPNEPRWWLAPSSSGDARRMEAVRDGRYTLHILSTAERFAMAVGVPLSSVRAIVRREAA